MNAREQIAEALLYAQPMWIGSFGPHEIADVLVPLVDRLRAEAAAEALEQAADWLWDDNGEAAAAYYHLRDRAEALRAGATR